MTSFPSAPTWVNHACIISDLSPDILKPNGDGIGEFKAVIEKLDYIKSLGVDAIWETRSLIRFSTTRVMTSGHCSKIAPRYGTNADARELFDEAHERHIKVLFDYVVTYTSGSMVRGFV